ncbi:MAG: hypothetical protein KAT34_02270 [Candidatus Aminicenantes bacterium]|nr:hypothetical protein [Candidatus Aminicenantes bacterium]
MGPITFAFLGSILFAIIISIIKYVSCNPWISHVKWMIDHPRRRESIQLKELFIDVFSLFSIGLLIVLFYNSYKLNPDILKVVGIALITAILCFILSSLAIGRINTIAILKNDEDKYSKYAILISWIIILVTIFDILPKIENNKLKNVAGNLYTNIYITFLLGVVITAIFVWKMISIGNLKNMSGNIDLFIHKYYSYDRAIKRIRSSFFKNFNHFDVDRENLVSKCKTDMLIEIINEMQGKEILNKYFNKSKLYNYFIFGILTETPVCALICIERLYKAVQHHALYTRNRSTLALIQNLKNQKKAIKIGLYCERETKSLEIRATINGLTFSYQPIIRLLVKKPYNRTISITDDFIYWIQP